MVVGGAAAGAAAGPTRGRKTKKSAGASSSLTREEREERLDAEIEKEVQRIIKGKKQSKYQLAVEDAGQRVKIGKAKQRNLASLPKFELDVNCDVCDYINLLKDRRFYHRTRASYHFGGGVVAIPPMDIEAFNMIEFMESAQSGTKRSVMQCLFCDNDLYYQLFRATPQKTEDRHIKGNFYRLGGVKREYPEEFFGKIHDVRGATESYDSAQMIAVYADVIKLMVQKVKKLTPARAKMFDPDLLPLVQLPIFAVCESERFPAAERFTIANFYSLTPQHVTSWLEELVHNWGRLSKLAFLIVLAIIEFDMEYHNCRQSFNAARANFHATLKACSTLKLDLNGPDGLFSLKKLLGIGGCLHVLKFEFADVIRIIMRARHDARGAITEIQVKLDVSDATSSNELVEEAKVSVPTSRSSIELVEADAEKVEVKVESSHERIEKESRVVKSDNAEWARWEQRRRAGGKVMDLLME